MTIHSQRDDDDRRMRPPRPVAAHIVQPSVIARLMGMDNIDDHAAAVAAPAPPLTARPAAGSSVQFQQPQRRRRRRRRHTSSYSYSHRGGGDSKQADDCCSGSSSSSSRLCLSRMTMLRVPRSGGGSGWPHRRRRRHPEEEELLLRKMRHDLHLQAWQAASNSKAASDYSDGNSNSRSSAASSSLVLQAIAQEDLRRQKMARYGFDLLGLGSGQHSKVTQQQDELLPLVKTKTAAPEPARLSHDKKKQDAAVVVVPPQGDPSSEHAEAAAAAAAATEPERKAMPPHHHRDRDLEEARSRDGRGGRLRHGAPAAQARRDLPSDRHTTIVLLKPTTACSEHESDTSTGGGGAAIGLLPAGLRKLVHRDAGMTMLLQEVKDRVQRELTLLTATATGGSRRGDRLNFNFKTPPPSASASASASACWAIPALHLQQQQQQATTDSTKEPDDRGGNGNNNKRRLFRSESFRAFRRDHRNRNKAAATPPAASPPEAARLLKSAKADDDDEKPMADDAGVAGAVTDDGQSFRSECLSLTTRHRDDVSSSPSPRLLLRSFSAPAEPGLSSFSSLGRLCSSTNSRQHDQASDSEPAAAAVTSKRIVSAAGFSSFIRGTVSTLRRHGFGSRRNRNVMMFRRKTHWSFSSNNNKTTSSVVGAAEIHPAKMEMEMPVCSTPPSPQAFNLFKVAQANLSELPPSPVSPLEVAAAGHSSRHFFTDLHLTLPAPELSPKCLSEFEPPATATVSESSFRTDITAVEAACSRDKAYITELLIAAGLYDSDGDGPPLSASNARVDSMASRPSMPICDDVFEDVEDMYYYRGDYIIGGMSDDHRMLFDLANEALQSLVVVAESSRGAGSSSLRRWIVDSTNWGVAARGKKLVDDVWEQVQALLRNHHRAQMQTIDGMVAYEVRRSVWAQEALLYEDVYVVGRKIERAIFDELVEDLLFACALVVFI